MAPSVAAVSPFVAEIPVRFAHCDTAGIVFYPRYFEMFSGVVEDWCADGLGVSFRELHLEQGLGLPTVHIETDFAAPSQLVVCFIIGRTNKSDGFSCQARRKPQR
jgi:4-hydroxybenzoyl-CoA thioesterase